MLNKAYKILSKLINNRQNGYAEIITGQHHAGFMKGKLTGDQIFVLYIYVLLVCIDLAKANDSKKKPLKYGS